MTRKHYVMLAEAMKKAMPIDFRGDNEYRYQWETDCHIIADTLAADNPRFDRNRFLKACGAME